jgi:hypothetical protein
VTLFTRRLTQFSTTPSEEAIAHTRDLHKMWADNRRPYHKVDLNQTSQAWQEFPISQNRVRQNRDAVLDQLNGQVEEDDDYYGAPDSISLYDILPLFMSLSAHVFEDEGWDVKPAWFELAGEFMLQAALEQYLVYKGEGIETALDCFAWGWQKSSGKRKRISANEYPHITTEELDGVEKEMRRVCNMFVNQDTQTEVQAWSGIRSKYVDFVRPQEDMRLVRQFELVAATNPICDFELKIVDFLEALTTAQPKPLLIQLEGGQIDGMTREETAELMERCGLEL